MSLHVPAHRWADALAGRLEASELTSLERHAQTCATCQRTRERVARASDSFATIRDDHPPELAWDTVRARVHWSVSKERRSQPRLVRRRELPVWAWGAIAMAAAGVLAIATGALAVEVPAPQADVVAAASIPPSAPDVAVTPIVPAAVTGVINRVVGELVIDGRGADDAFVRRLGAGSVLATGDGRVDVQFGDATAFALGPRSTLELRRFDAERIELVVDGSIDLQVAPRIGGQRLMVTAGDHTVEVRGTQFRVERIDGVTHVACRHGRVEVRDRAAQQVEIGAARHAQLATGGVWAPELIVPLTVDELSALAATTPLTMPVWDVDLETRTAPLEILAHGSREIRVDGVEVGVAPLRVRVMPGRHTVEATDRAGRYRRVGWVDVAAPTPGAAIARLEVPSEPPRTAGVAARRRQLRAGIDHARLARCMRSIAKSGVTDTFVQVEISVEDSGAVGFLNVIDTDLPSTTSGCVREVLADVRFGAGAAATWRERLDL